jgi:hypothetical protein
LTAFQEVPPPQVDAGGMRMMNNHYGFSSVQSSCNYACAWRRTAALQDQSVRSDAWRMKGVFGVDNDGQGCQGLCAELFVLCRYYFWRQMPRPLGTQLHATKPIVILHFDFLYIGLSSDGMNQYPLLLKDELGGYLWHVPCRTADAAATVDALMRSFEVFGVVLLWISDRGSHFKNTDAMVCSVWCRADMDIA